MTIKAVILAAGKGTRLRSEDGDIPKVMRKAAGRCLLDYVLTALSFIPKEDIIIVAGYKKEEVIGAFPGYNYAIQDRQLGTGHAVMAAAASLGGYSGDVLVCYGDMPALKRETYLSLVESHVSGKNDCTMLTGQTELTLPYGRIVRDADGRFLETVEDRDCTPEQKAIKELNIGIYMFKTQLLLSSLSELKNDNSQGEYYLTDVPKIIRAGGGTVGLCNRDLGHELIGVNTQDDLLRVEEFLKNDA